MSDARRYTVWPEPRSRSLKGSRPSVPHGTNLKKNIFNAKKTFFTSVGRHRFVGGRLILNQQPFQWTEKIGYLGEQFICDNSTEVDAVPIK